MNVCFRHVPQLFHIYIPCPRFHIYVHVCLFTCLYFTYHVYIRVTTDSRVIGICYCRHFDLQFHVLTKLHSDLPYPSRTVQEKNHPSELVDHGSNLVAADSFITT